MGDLYVRDGKEWERERAGGRGRTFITGFFPKLAAISLLAPVFAGGRHALVWPALLTTDGPTTGEIP